MTASSVSEQIAAIAAAWRQAKRPVVFTGAGMSTESGLPDFRSAQGLWKTRPESLATLRAQQTQPDEFYFFYQWRIAKVWSVSPNLGHQALAALEERGYLSAVITQNVDGLHQRAGSQKVIELHGSLRTVSCLACGAAFGSRQLLPARAAWEDEYLRGDYHYGDECRCPRCKGFLRPDVVLFGESLPHGAWQEAVSCSQSADFFVVAGSSLAVAPANLCPEIALRQGAKLVIINRDATPLDSRAAWVIRQDLAGVLDAIRRKIIEENA